MSLESQTAHDELLFLDDRAILAIALRQMVHTVRAAATRQLE